MKNRRTLLWVGIALTVLGLGLVLYNFFPNFWNMYYTCVDYEDFNDCSYNTMWKWFSSFSCVILTAGLLTIILYFLKKRK